MISDDYNSSFVNGQNILTGESQLQSVLLQNPVSTTLTSDLNGNGVYSIVNIRDPVVLGDAVNLNYFNNHSGGGTPSLIRNNTVLTSQLQANTTQLLNGSTPLNMNTQKIINVVNPASAQDVATKNYVDTALSGISSSSIQNVAPNAGYSSVNCVNQNSITMTVANSTMLSLNVAGNSLAGGLNMLGFNVSNIGTPTINSDATPKIYVDNGLGTKYTNTTSLNNITLATGDINVNTHKITNVVDPTLIQDVSTKNYTDTQVATKQSQTQGDARYYLNTVPLNLITVASGDVNLNTHKITNIVNPTNAQDASTKIYVDTGLTTKYPNTTTLNQISTTSYNTGNIDMNGFECINNAVVPSTALSLTSKSYVDQQVNTRLTQSQANASYYLNNTPLNSITTPSADVSLNTYKITNLLAGSTTTDGYQYGQAQTALTLKRDKTTTLQASNLEAPLISNLDLNTGFNTLIKTPLVTDNNKSAVNIEYINNNSALNESLFITSTTLQATSSKQLGFTISTQSGSTNIVFDNANQTITLKAGFTYNIIARASFIGINATSLLSYGVYNLSTNTYLDNNQQLYGVQLTVPTNSSDTNNMQQTLQTQYKPTVNTTIYIQNVTVTAITSLQYSVSVVQIPSNYSVVQSITPSQIYEYIQMQSNTQPVAGVNYVNADFSSVQNQTSTQMSYSNGVITLIPGTYKVTIYMNKYTASSNQFNTLQLMNTTTNTALFTSLYSWNAQASQLSCFVPSGFNFGTSEFTQIFTLTSSVSLALQSAVNGGGSLIYISFKIETQNPFNSSANTTSNLIVNSDLNSGSTYRFKTQATATGPYDIMNKNQNDTTFVQYTSTINQLALPTANLNMNNNKITNVSPGTISTDVCTFGQLNAGSVQNPLITNLSGQSLYKIINAINGSSAQDYVTLSQSQSFNNGYRAIRLDNILNSQSSLSFSNNNLVLQDNVQSTSTNPYMFLKKNGKSTFFIPDSSFLENGSIEFQSDNINSPVFTLDKTQAKTIFSNYPVEIRNNTTAVTNSIGLLNVGLPYTNVYSIVANGSILAAGFVVAMPSSRKWKTNIIENDQLDWIDNMKIYQFDYDIEKLKESGINPDCIIKKHMKCGVMMEEIDPQYYLKSEDDSSWGGQDIIDRMQIDQLLIARHQQRIQQQQRLIDDVIARVYALEHPTQLQQKIQSLDNPFIIDQLSSDEEPVILDTNDIPKQKSGLFKSIF